MCCVPPGSVTTTDAGSGTTVITTNAAAPAPAGAPQPMAPQNYAPQPNMAQPVAPNPGAPQLAPFGTAPTDNGGNVAAAVGGAAAGAAITAAVAPSLNAAPASSTGDAAPIASGAPVPNAANPSSAPGATPDAAAGVAPGAAPEQPPAPGGIICVPVRVPEPDPADNTKTIEVEKIACYPAPPAEATTPAPAATNATEAAAVTPTASSATTPTTTTTSAPAIAPAAISNSEIGVPLAPLTTLTPIVVPEGSVALAPLSPNRQPDIMKLPGTYYARRSLSNVELAESSGLLRATARATSNYANFGIATVLTLVVAFCMH
uniref:Uncharacterized protein n=1 Tax=Bactrocera dorsalis TaxID=27457 RepID=A0A034W6Q7_BACDO